MGENNNGAYETKRIQIMKEKTQICIFDCASNISNIQSTKDELPIHRVQFNEGNEKTAAPINKPNETNY